MTPRSIFDICLAAGRENTNEFGAVFVPALEASFLLLATGHRTYTDKPSIRARRHVLLVAEKSTGKTELIENIFPMTLAASRRLGDLASPEDITTPKHYILTRDTSPERVRGGLTSRGTVIPPIVKSCDLLIIGEFTQVGGTKEDDVKDRAFWLNRIMEEGRFENGLVKYFDISEDEVYAVASNCKSAGMHFDVRNRVISYDTDCTVWGATVPFDPKVHRIYTEAGLLSRFAEYVVIVPDARMREARRAGFYGPIGDHHVKTIRSLNELAWRTHFETLNYPPAWMMTEMRNLYCDTYDDIVRDTGVSYGEVANGRDELDMAQLLTAACIARTLQAIGVKTASPVIPSLTYTSDDLAVAKKLALSHLSRHYMKFQDRTEHDPMAAVAQREFGDMLRLIKDPEERMAIHRHRFAELLSKVAVGGGASPATVTRRLSTLRKNSIVYAIPGRPGWYAPEDAFIVPLGLAPQHIEVRYHMREPEHHTDGHDDSGPILTHSEPDDSPDDHDGDGQSAQAAEGELPNGVLDT